MIAMPRCCVLDVGHGNAAVLFGDHQCVVIDAGPRNHLIKFLEAQRVTRVDSILVSHADADHIGGVMALVSKALVDPDFSIGHIYLNPDPRATETFHDLVFALNRLYKAGKTLWTISIGEGDPPPFDAGGCEVHVIAPSKALRVTAVDGKPAGAKKTSANAMSAVVRISCAGNPWLLLPGDLDRVGLDHLIADGGNVATPVLVFPHHGGMAGSVADTQYLVDELLRRTGASSIVFSARTGSAKFPSELVVQAILATSNNPPAIWSIGRSEVLDAAVAGLAHHPHCNGVGSIEVSMPTTAGPITFQPV